MSYKVNRVINPHWLPLNKMTDEQLQNCINQRAEQVIEQIAGGYDETVRVCARTLWRYGNEAYRRRKGFGDPLCGVDEFII